MESKDAKQSIKAFPSIVSEGKGRTAYLAGVLAGGNLFATAIKVISGIITARLVEPSVLGLFSGIGLIMGYVPFLTLGISNGLNRELPYYIGKNERFRAEQLAAAAQSWLLILGIASAAALMMVSGYQLYLGKFWHAVGWATHSLLVFLYFYSTSYLQITYRTSNDFARLAIVNVVQALAALVLLILVWLMNFYGLCLRGLFSVLLTAILLYIWRPVRVAPKFSVSNLRHLASVGLPIFIVGQVYGWWSVINMTLVLYFMGTRGMGLYSMVVMTAGAVALLPQALIEVTYPRMSELYGRGQDTETLMRTVAKPMYISAACMVPLVFIAWIMMDPMMRYFVPKYVDAVAAMKWSLLQPVVMCFAPMNNVFNVVRRQDLYFIAILSGMAVYGACLFLLVRESAVLEAFPQAMLAGYTAFIITCACFIRLIKSKESSGRNIHE